MNLKFIWESHKLPKHKEEQIEGSFTRALEIITSPKLDLSKLKVKLTYIENRTEPLIVGIASDQEENILFVCSCEYENGNKTYCYPYVQKDSLHKV